MQNRIAWLEKRPRQSMVAEKAAKCTEWADSVVHDVMSSKPLLAIGATVILGIVLGWMVKRR